jgi:hypothetical protein
VEGSAESGAEAEGAQNEPLTAAGIDTAVADRIRRSLEPIHRGFRVFPGWSEVVRLAAHDRWANALLVGLRAKNPAHS